MYQPAWDEISKFYTLPHTQKDSVSLFQSLQTSQSFHTKKEGATAHYCVFFLPYDPESGQIYLGHHKKANDWIPPGGHLEPGETPIQAAIREMKEELGVDITPDQLSPFSLSVKPINRPERGCLTHYDIWHLVRISPQPFTYLQSEYHDARWFTLSAGIKQITKNPDFAKIIQKLR